MQNNIRGTFHFHSTYSHDGRSTLSEVAATLRAQDFSFCVMTDHFEDFDTAKFDRYILEIREVSRGSGFLLIPGIEVNLSGLDTVVFPVRDYESIARLQSEAADTQPSMFKVLVHPSKYAFPAVVKHLSRYTIHAVELWNQQADGSQIPPLAFLQLWKNMPERNRYRYFFGCDLHKATLTVSNYLSIAAAPALTEESVAAALMEGDFVARNIPTGIEYRNGVQPSEFDPWLLKTEQAPYMQGKLLRGVRRCLKPVYSCLPRDVRHSLNDVKNFVRNKI